MPVKMEDRLTRSRTDVDEYTVVLEADVVRGFGDELEHSFRLVRRELGDLAKARDVALRQDEQVRLRLGIDVLDRDEAFARPDVVALSDKPAEEAVLRQR
jgi:hypothetical protein